MDCNLTDNQYWLNTYLILFNLVCFHLVIEIETVLMKIEDIN